MRSWLGALLVAIALGAIPGAARADGAAGKAAGERREPATVLAAVIDDGARRRAGPGEAELGAMLEKLDELLLETARDLGLVSDGKGPDPTAITEREMLELARRKGSTVIAAVVRDGGGEIELRITLASPARRALLVRTERFDKGDLAVRAVVMLRDVVTEAGIADRLRLPAPAPSAPPPPLAVAARSEGRTVLAVNATVLGGMMGFSIERASGSNDPRLLYPLLAVGAGVGLGASLLIAGEWDVGTGDAWFLSSGAVWPTVAAHLIYEGRFGGASGHPGPEGERWAFGLVGGTAGIALSTLSLALGDMDNGGAVLAHSGGAIGLGFGGLTEWLVRGDARNVPFAGMGYGAALGWLAAAGVATTRVRLPPVRVLSIDLGVVLGGLAGAALASPLMVDGPTSTQTRGWAAAIGGGALLGAGVAAWLTRGARPGPPGSPQPVKIAAGMTVLPDLPEVGILAPTAPDDLQASAPTFGVRFRGRW
jgi:hypothetical protein